MYVRYSSYSYSSRADVPRRTRGRLSTFRRKFLEDYTRDPSTLLSDDECALSKHLVLFKLCSLVERCLPLYPISLPRSCRTLKNLSHL